MDLRKKVGSLDFGGGGILGPSDLDSQTIFIWGGILGPSDLDSLTIFIGGGGILGPLDLDFDNFHFGGYSGTLKFGLPDNFHLEGGILYQVTTE